MLQTLRVARITAAFNISASRCGEHTILPPQITDALKAITLCPRSRPYGSEKRGSRRSGSRAGRENLRGQCPSRKMSVTSTGRALRVKLPEAKFPRARRSFALFQADGSIRLVQHFNAVATDGRLRHRPTDDQLLRTPHVGRRPDDIPRCAG